VANEMAHFHNLLLVKCVPALNIAQFVQYR